MSRPTCPGLDLLSPYADGELSVAETREMDRHLAACPSCARRLRALRDLDGLLFEGRTDRGRRLPIRLALAGALAAVLLVAIRAPRPEEPRPDADRPAVSVTTLADAAAANAPSITAGPRERVARIVDAHAAGLGDAAGELREIGLAGRRHLRDMARADRPEIARAALELLATLGDRTAARFAIEALDRPDIAAVAATTLADLGTPDAIPHLVRCYRQGRARASMVKAIARIGGTAGARALGSLIAAEPDRITHESLAAAIHRLGSTLAGPVYASLLDAPDLREDAARALVALGDDASIAVLLDAVTVDPADPVTEVLAELGPEAEFRLGERFAGGSHHERRRLIRLLGLCGGESALARLDECIDDPALADEAVRALGRLGGGTPATVDVLRRAGHRPALRLLVLDALGETRRPEAVPVLVDLAMDLTTTRSALAALGTIPGDEAIRAVLTLMERPRCERAARRALLRQDPVRVACVRSDRDEEAPSTRGRAWPEI